MNENYIYDRLAGELIETEYVLNLNEKSEDIAATREAYIGMMNEKYTNQAEREAAMAYTVNYALGQPTVEEFMEELIALGINTSVLGQVMGILGDSSAWGTVANESRLNELLELIDNFPAHQDIFRFAAWRAVLTHLLHSGLVARYTSQVRLINSRLSAYTREQTDVFQLMKYPGYIRMYYDGGERA